jgi:hypothetical protein
MTLSNMDEQQIRNIIREELAFMIKNKKLVFPFPIQILDGNDIILASEHGTRIGTASTQKLGFLGATPIAKQAGALRDMSTEPTPGVSSTDYSARAGVQDINAVLTTLGLASH